MTNKYKVGDEVIINDPKQTIFAHGTHGLRAKVIRVSASPSGYHQLEILEGSMTGRTQYGPTELISPASKASGNSFPANVVSGWTPHPPEERQVSTRSKEGEDDPHRGMVYNAYNKKWVWC